MHARRHAVVVAGLVVLALFPERALAAWGQPHSVAPSSRTGASGRVAYAPSGDLIAVWHRFEATHHIVESAVRSSGGSWGPAVRISRGNEDARYPELAVDDSGNAIAIWAVRYAEQTEVVQASRRNVGSGAWESPQQLSRPLPGDGNQWSAGGHVDFDAAGNATAAWANIWHQTIEVATRGAGERAWTTPLTISTPPTRTHPQIVVNPSGEATVAWSGVAENNAIVRSAIRPGPTATWLPEQTLSVPNSYFSGLAVHPSGHAVAIWDRFPRVEAAVRPAGSTAWSAPQTLAMDATNASVALDGDANAIALWRENDPSRVRAAMRAPADAVWGPAVTISGEMSANSGRAGFDGFGNALVLFDQVVPEYHWVIQARIRDVGTGAWAPAETLSRSEGDSRPLDLAVDLDGDAFALWSTYVSKHLLDGAAYDRRRSSPGYDPRPWWARFPR